jgi:hypothetical protein
MTKTDGSGVLTSIMDAIVLTTGSQTAEVEILDEASALLQMSFTKGTETNMTFNIMLSTDDGTTYFDAFRGLVPVEETFTATSLERYSLLLPGFVNKLKVSAIATGTPTGTITVGMRRSSVNNPISI